MTRSREVERIARRVMRRAVLAPDGRSWYRDARAYARLVTGEEGRARVLLSCYAACSHHQTDARAWDLAALAFDLMEDGRPFPESSRPWGPAWRGIVANLRRVESGDPVQGPKLAPFERALHGDDDAVVLDRWMFRVGGFEYVNLRRAQGRRLADGVRVAARRLGWPVAEAQAAAWTAEREGRMVRRAREARQEG